MSCEQTRLILHAYFDSELDAVRAAEFEGHLQDCAECMAALETQKLLRDAIHRRNMTCARLVGLSPNPTSNGGSNAPRPDGNEFPSSGQARFF